MRIFIKDVDNNGTICDPLINIVRLDDGYLEYLTVNEINDIPNIVSLSEESYEEAVEALNNQKL